MNKKSDALAQQKTFKAVEPPEDVEVEHNLSAELPFACHSQSSRSVDLYCFENLQPAEMSLEEIESRLGSLIQSDTISQLKSAVWKERLEGL